MRSVRRATGREDLVSGGEAKSFKAAEVCSADTQPFAQEALMLHLANVKLSLFFLDDCQVGDASSHS